MLIIIDMNDCETTVENEKEDVEVFLETSDDEKQYLISNLQLQLVAL